MFETLVKVLTPSLCMGCEKPLEILCDGCRPEHLIPLPHACYGCGARSDGNLTCPRCRQNRGGPMAVWSVTKFDGLAKKLVYRMKFDANREVAELLGELLDEMVPQIDIDVVTFVPAAPKRRRERSFDHAKLMAEAFANKRKLPVQTLIGRLNNSRQLGGSKTQRRQQALEAYISLVGEKYDKVLLIDDVISTGATIEAGAKLLRKAGHKEIYVACFARN